MDMNEFLGGQYLGKTDVDTRGTDFQITGVTKETVGQELETKPVLQFRGAGSKPMTLNKTNTRILIAMFGSDSRDWVGRWVNVFNDPTVVFNGTVGGLRVRPSCMEEPEDKAAQYAKAAQADARTTAPAAPQFDDDIPF